MMQFSAGDSRVIGGTTYVRDETGNWHAQGGAPASPASGFVPLTPPDPIGMRHKQLENTSLESNIAQTPVQIRNTQANTARTDAELPALQQRPALDRFGSIDKMRDNVRADKRIQTYEQAVPIWSSALKSPDTPAGDTMLVNAAAKIGDPTTGVQQREGDAWENTQTTIEQVRAQLAKQFGADANGNFTPEGRARIKAALTARMHGLADAYNAARTDWRTYIQHSGVPGANPDVILGPHFGLNFQQNEADYKQQTGAKDPLVHNLDGSVGAVPHGYVPPNMPYDPSGAGNIGFMQNQRTDNLPPNAEGYQKALDTAIRTGQIKTEADLRNWIEANRGPANIHVEEKYIGPAAKAIAAGQMPDVQTPAYEKPDISDVRNKGAGSDTYNSMVRGIADIPTFGTIDKLVAAGDTLFKGGTMEGNLNRQYAISDFDQQNHPWARFGGQAIGGFTLPMGEMDSIGQILGKSAAVGGAYSAGSSRSLSDVPMNLATGAGAGAATAGALNGLGPVTRYVAGQVGRRLAGPLDARQQGIINAANEEGVPINTSDIYPGSQNTVATLETIPGSSGLIRRGIAAGRDAIEQRVQALGRGGTARQDMGEVVQGAARRFVARSAQQADNLYNRARNLAGNVPIMPQQVMQTLAGLVRQEAQVPGGTRAGAVIQRYADAFQNGGPITIDGARAMRSELLSRLRDDGGLSRSQATRLTGQVMDAVSQDIESSLTQQGRGAAVQAFRTADRFYADRMNEIEQVTEHFIGTNDRPLSAEQTLSRMQNAAGQKGNSAGLRQMLSRLNPDERADYAATLVEPLGRRSADEPFSPATFMQNVRKLSPNARRIIFGQDGERSIQNLVRLSNAKNEAVQRLNNSRSGMTINYKTVLSSILFSVPGGGAVAGMAMGLNGATGAVGGAAIGASALAASRSLSRALMDENFTRLLANAPATTNPRAINAHFGQLRQLAVKNPALQGAVQTIEQRVLHAIRERQRGASAPSRQVRRQRWR
jgi:hypothetical protein